MNQVLTLEQVLGLEDGARVWVEVRFDHRFDGIYFRAKKDGDADVLRQVDSPDTGCWIKSHYVNETYRVWSLPQPPTSEELAAWPWPEVEHA